METFIAHKKKKKKRLKSSHQEINKKKFYFKNCSLEGSLGNSEWLFY